MRKVKNITVSVTPQVYRDARHLAADYDSTVSAFVAWLLPRLRISLERTRFPKGGVKPSSQPATTVNYLVAPPPHPPYREIPTPETSSLAPETRLGGETAKPDCATVPACLTGKDSAACSHQAAPAQPLCNCTAALKQTETVT